MTRIWHRVGFHASPVAFPPHEFLSWSNRFDDPRPVTITARFRTLYFAHQRYTALAEVFQDLRPSTKDIADFTSLFGVTPPPQFLPCQRRSDLRVGRTRLDADGPDWVDLEDLSVRRDLEEQHASLLARHGMLHLDLSQLRSDQRIVTQTIALDLFGQGKAGIKYRSNLTNGDCLAVFERGPSPRQYGPARTIATNDVDLLTLQRNWKFEIES